MIETNSIEKARSKIRGAPWELTSAQSARQDLQREWEELCTRYLPVASTDSVWRLSRARALEVPEQGWKLHISATVLTACDVLNRIAPYLTTHGVFFKAVRSLAEASKLNCGIYYGYSQIGKLITVYPTSVEQARAIARKLHQLTRGISAPAVPFDRRYRSNSCVFYRYGAFHFLKVEQPDGTALPGMRTPNGSLIPDRRAPSSAVPSWETDPFSNRRTQVTPKPCRARTLGTSIFAYRALSQRGKGGVYKALDISSGNGRLCILKEGRRHGETAWDGRDGYWRVQHESNVLAELVRGDVPVPAIYSSFRSRENYYLVTELITGSNLQELIANRPTPLSLRQALRYGLSLAELLAKIHGAGWVWRDCKPSNLMIAEDDEMRPLDFEGAHRINEIDATPWGTFGYVPPEWQLLKASPVNGAAQDLYALGAVLNELLCGRVPVSQDEVTTRSDLPPQLGLLVTELLDLSPDARPVAQVAFETLRSLYAAYGGQ